MKVFLRKFGKGLIKKMIERILNLQPIGALETTIEVVLLIVIVWVGIRVGWFLANIAIRIWLKF